MSGNSGSGRFGREEYFGDDGTLADKEKSTTDLFASLDTVGAGSASEIAELERLVRKHPQQARALVAKLPK